MEETKCKTNKKIKMNCSHMYEYELKKKKSSETCRFACTGVATRIICYVCMLYIYNVFITFTVQIA